MISIRSTLLALSSLFIITTPSFANVNYSLTAGSDSIFFSLPQNPTPLACDFLGIDTSCFSVSPVSLTVDGTPGTGYVSFFLPGVGGGLTIYEGATLLVNNDGPGNEQLFSGTLASPTLETFSNLQLTIAPAGGPVY